MKATIAILILAICAVSCTTTSHGYNYKAHAKKNAKIGNHALKINGGKQLTNYTCTHKKH